MNWLAHILLSGDDIHHQLGNLLADPLRGRAWSGADKSLLAGMSLHKSIDRFTDAHAVFQKTIKRLGYVGRLRAVVADIVYDHFLARHWQQFCVVSLVDYIVQFNRNALLASQHFPYRARSFVTDLVLSDRLGTYGTLAGLVATLERMDHRLSTRLRRRERASDYESNIRAFYTEIETDFLCFFPELVAFCQKEK